MFKISFSLAAGLILLSGCAHHRAEPRTLKIAVNEIYCTETACACVHDVASRSYDPFLNQLAETGIQLEFTYFIEPYQLEEALLSGQYDGVLSKPWLALRLQESAGADFERVADLLDPGNNGWLSGIVIVPADSAIQSLEELTGKRVVIGEAESYEKHQAALRLFETRKIKPTGIETRASCGENIGELLDGHADAAVISDYALSADCAVDFANPEDFRTLEHTEKIPLTSLMINRNKVSGRQVQQLKKSLLTLSGNPADEALLSKGFIAPVPWNPPELKETP
ncbi:phosphate/phosphite/phosphonate ABC transporter substrate-binding protein [Pontiella sp.]|uniref:phosphate/phosphite/phosphonate ABC transporter substrate-binding protein n=1 Tax=Pontiella sp. TaxID=2837462 RepID=UPI0035626BA4